MKSYCITSRNGSEYYVTVYLTCTNRTSSGAFPSKTRLRLDCSLVTRVSLKTHLSTIGNFAHLVLTDLDAEEEKAMQAEIKDKFNPLLSWLKVQAEGIVRDGSHCVDLSTSL